MILDMMVEKSMNDLVIVRGGGDIATGTIYKLYQCGFSVLVLETERPSAIRRMAAFSEAVYQGQQKVEDVTCYLAKDIEDAVKMLSDGRLVMLIDPQGMSICELSPLAVIDAVLAKKNMGTYIDMAPITIGLGPGFEAGTDVDAVIETMRGHTLGRVIYHGKAIDNTGIPGKIAGYDKERVIYSPVAGILKHKKNITDTVYQGEEIAEIDTGSQKIPVMASIDGILRGLIRNGFSVTEGFKIADIDPRVQEYENCFTISDKARCIAGGVLEAIWYLRRRR